MIDLYTEHINITKEVKEKLVEKKVVFPADYGKIYSVTAKEHNVELHTDQLLSNEMLDEKMVRHIITLHDSASEALEAMQTNDAQKLKNVMKETEKLKQEIQELQKLVYEDSLTKIYNRKWFNDTYISELDNNSMKSSGTLVIIDLNDFKHINDDYGHIVGDKVLTYVASKLKESDGKVIRYGGDEFLIIFDNDKNSQEISSKIEKLVEYFHKKSFKLESVSFKISFAYGIASFDEGSNLESVIEIADKAMYGSKKRKS